MRSPSLDCLLRRKTGRSLSGGRWELWRNRRWVPESSRWRPGCRPEPDFVAQEKAAHWVRSSFGVRGFWVMEGEVSPESRIVAEKKKLNRPTRLALLLVLVPGFLFSADNTAPQARLIRGDFLKRLTFSGELQAVSSTAISTPALTSQWSFRIAQLIPEGSIVEPGEVLVRFDATELELKRLELEQKREEARIKIAQKTAEIETRRQDLLLALAQAERNYSVDKLYAEVDPQLIPRSKAEEYQFKLAKSSLELEKAREKLKDLDATGEAELEVVRLEFNRADLMLKRNVAEMERLSVRAETPGLVVYERLWDGRKVQLGETLYKGWPIIRLPDMSRVRVRAIVHDSDFPLLIEGMPARVTLDAAPGEVFSGHLSRLTEVSKPVNRQSEMNVFLVDFLLDQSAPVMKPGMTARVEVEVRRPGALLAPRTALGVDSKGSHFLTVEGKGRVEVEALDANQTQVWVSGDLTEADSLVLPRRDQPDSADQREWITVKKEELLFSVSGNGVLGAAKGVDLGAPPVPNVWRFKILQMAPEGKQVESGEVVLRFDPSEVDKQLLQERAELDKSLQERDKTKASLSLQEEDMRLEVEEARAQSEKASNKLRQSRQFESSLKIQEAELDATLAARRVELLEKKLAATREHWRLQLEILEDAVNLHKGRIDAAVSAMDQMTVHSPGPGMVTYETDWNNQKKQVGSEVYVMETIISIPELSTLRVKGQVAEVDAGKVRLGQAVSVSLDAIPDRAFSGTISRVGNIFTQASPDTPSVKVLEIDVTLDSVDERRMRPEMVARLQIEVDRFSGVVAVPLTAVQLDEDGQTYVTVRDQGRIEKRRVRLGKDNGIVVVVLEGLKEGDEVAGKRLDDGAKV